MNFSDDLFLSMLSNDTNLMSMLNMTNMMSMLNETNFNESSSTLEDFEVFDLRDAMNVLVYSVMSAGEDAVTNSIALLQLECCSTVSSWSLLGEGETRQIHVD